MDFIIVIHYLGLFLCLYSLSFLIPLIPILFYKEYELIAPFVSSSFVTLLIGGVGGLSTYYLVKMEERKVQIRESLCLVGLGWFFVTVLGGLPYYFSGRLEIIDAIFESISGFTTTGATVITAVSSFPKGLLFWRAFTHFLGGLGMAIIFVSVLPYIGAGGRVLFESESFTPDVKLIKPRIRETVKKLFLIYVLLNAINTLLLVIGGMNLFEAVCHAFATLATGGFSTRDKSIEEFQSIYIEVVTIVFMLLGGTNLLLLFDGFLRGRIKNIIKDVEWRTYISLCVICILIATFFLTEGISGIFSSGSSPYNFSKALRESAFNFVSLMTCTGFSNSDFDKWPYFVKWLLMVVTIIGGCAGSTAGGIKVIRFVILTKILWNRILVTFQPKTVKPVIIGKVVVSEDIQRDVLMFCLLWLVVILISSLLLCSTGLSIVTSVSAVIACFSNAGPGLEIVGPYGNYAGLSNVAKVILDFIMLAGRVEMFSIFVLFVPSFWKRK